MNAGKIVRLLYTEEVEVITTVFDLFAALVIQVCKLMLIGILQCNTDSNASKQ